MLQHLRRSHMQQILVHRLAQYLLTIVAQVLAQFTEVITPI